MNFKLKIDQRQAANREIIEILSDVVERYPELRFGQILAISNIILYEHISCDSDQYVETVKDPFNEESVDMLPRVRNKIQNLNKNQNNHE